MSESERPISLMETEFQQFDENGAWLPIYHRLRNEASLNHQFTVKVARSPENRTRNRYRDVSPYDHSRVILQNGQNDYINANLVEAPEANRKYILSQGPLRNTSGHFWQMVWEQNSKAIVMLNRVIERDTIKCDQYWPLGSSRGYTDEMIFEDTFIKVTLKDEQDNSYYIIRTLEIEFLETEEKKTVLHFHYTTWPDFGVPQSPAAFLNFLMAVRRSGVLDREVGPAVVHCSAGIGRSGTFCLVDTCLVLIEQRRDMTDLDLRAILLDMRKYRMGLIQTADQFRFSYIAVIEGGKRILNSSLDSGFEEFDQESLSPAKPPRTHTNPTFVDDSDSTDDDVEEFIIDDNGSDSENGSDGEPPPLPPRRNPPPVPPRRQFANSPLNDESDNVDVSAGDQNSVQLEKEQNNVSEEPKKGEFGIRRRNREERSKTTAAQIALMKERQRSADMAGKRRWRGQRLYAGIGCVSLLVLGGCYWLYTKYLY
ncbi:tyrosine-protein phosphatase non-receptor type 2-like [Lineus longissimus]|uniref:tyrosine-protein phosphatase non-receptor type 2-like n=1 Tax=Lineus longissimus TaxID=88925 RepID=UPI002B4CF758